MTSCRVMNSDDVVDRSIRSHSSRGCSARAIRFDLSDAEVRANVSRKTPSPHGLIAKGDGTRLTRPRHKDSVPHDGDITSETRFQTRSLQGSFAMRNARAGERSQPGTSCARPVKTLRRAWQKPRKKQGFDTKTRLPARGRELAASVLTLGELAEEALAYAPSNLGQHPFLGFVAAGWKTCRGTGHATESFRGHCVPASPTQEAPGPLC